MSKRLYLFVAAAVLVSLNPFASAQVVTFFGEDLGTAGSPASPRPNSDGARDTFLLGINSPGVEDFEGFAPGAAPPLVVNFGPNTATLTGTGVLISNVQQFGQFEISPTNRVRVDGQGGFTITFNTPQAAFGFYATDVGDVNGQLTVTVNFAGGGSQVINVPNQQGTDGTALYFGILAPTLGETFTSINFDNTGATNDVFGFDDMTIGTLDQVLTQLLIPPDLVMLVDLALYIPTSQMYALGKQVVDRRSGRSGSVILADVDRWYMPQSPTDNALAFASDPSAWISGAQTMSIAAAMAQADRDAESDEVIPSRPDLFGPDSRLAGFGTARLTFGQQDLRVQGGSGEDYYLVSGTVGLDYQFTDRVIAGVALGYSWSEADLPNGGDVDVMGITPSVYATWAITESWYVDAMAAYTYLDYEMARTIVTGGGTFTANSEPVGHIITARAQTGYDFVHENWVISPIVRGDYSYALIEGYSESGTSGFEVKVDDTESNSLQSRLGGQIVYIHQEENVILVPSVRGFWVHEFMDDDRNIEGTLVNVPTAVINVPVDDPDRDFIELGAGISANFDEGWAVFINYDVTLANEDYTAHTFAVGARVEF